MTKPSGHDAASLPQSRVTGEFNNIPLWLRAALFSVGGSIEPMGDKGGIPCVSVKNIFQPVDRGAPHEEELCRRIGIALAAIGVAFRVDHLTMEVSVAHEERGAPDEFPLCIHGCGNPVPIQGVQCGKCGKSKGMAGGQIGSEAGTSSDRGAPDEREKLTAEQYWKRYFEWKQFAQMDDTDTHYSPGEVCRFAEAYAAYRAGAASRVPKEGE